MNKNIINCLISLVLITILITLILTDIITPLDYFIASKIPHTNYLTTIFKFITFFGSTLGIISICLLLLFFVKSRQKLFFIYSTILVSTLINNIVKIIIARPRPILEHLVEETTYSFPSGHAMATLTFYGSLIYLIIHSSLSTKKKFIITTLLSLLIILIGFSRIYLNVHHFSDIIGGYLFSIVILNISILIQNK